MDYSDKLRDPRWQKLRLSVFQRDNWTCKKCGNKEKTLHIHHIVYHKNKEPWEYSMDDLMTLCEACHEAEKYNTVRIPEPIHFFHKRFAPQKAIRIGKMIDAIHDEWKPKEVLNGKD